MMQVKFNYIYLKMKLGILHIKSDEITHVVVKNERIWLFTRLFNLIPCKFNNLDIRLALLMKMIWLNKTQMKILGK